MEMIENTYQATLIPKWCTRLLFSTTKIRKNIFLHPNYGERTRGDKFAKGL